MDENKKLEGMTPAPQEQPENSPESVEQRLEMDTAAQNPKKSKFSPVLIVICVVVIAAIAAFASYFMGGDPQKKVQQAWEATSADYNQLMEQMQAELPAYGAFYTKMDASKTTFDFSVDSIEMDGVAVAEIEMVNAILNGTGLRGDFVSDSTTGSMEFSGAVHMGDMDLLDLYAYLSPETIAFNIPSFSDTVLSINPQTLAEDLKQSVLTSDMTDEEAQQFQSMVNGLIEAAKAYSAMDYEQMQNDIYAITGNAFTNAVYAEGEKSGSANTYLVTIPGEDVKEMLVQLVEYVYLDSALGKLYEAIPMSGTDATTFADMIVSEIIEPMREQMYNLDTVITLTVGSGNLIEHVNVVITPSPASNTSSSASEASSDAASEAIVQDEMLGKIVLDADYQSGTGISSAKAEVYSTADETQPIMVMDLSESYADGIYEVNVTADVTVEQTSMNLTESMTYDKDGAIGFTMRTEMPDYDGLGNNMAYDIVVDGTMTKDGEKIVYDFPTIQYLIDVMGQKMGANFTANATTEPIEAPYAFTKETTPLLGMTEEELTAEMDKYSAGMESVGQQLMTMLFSFSN